MISLQVLTGLIVSKVEEIHDYIQVVFSDGTILSIFNNYSYDGENLLGIEGKKVKSVEKSDDNFFIFLEDGRFISIGLEEDNFNGPEAIVLKQEGKPPIVWS